MINKEIYYKQNNNIEWCLAVEYESVIQCQDCGWWEPSYTFTSDDVDEGLRATSLEVTRAVLREYNLNSNEIPIDILNNYIKKNPSRLYGINDKKMEELTGAVFKDFYDCEILLDGEKQTFIQVKRRTCEDKVEPVSSIRDLLGASMLDGANSCIFVTTADHFSKPAQKAAIKAEEKGLVEKFELIDYSRFVEMLKLQKFTLPNIWESILQIKEGRDF